MYQQRTAVACRDIVEFTNSFKHTHTHIVRLLKRHVANLRIEWIYHGGQGSTHLIKVIRNHRSDADGTGADTKLERTHTHTQLSFEAHGACHSISSQMRSV